MKKNSNYSGCQVHGSSDLSGATVLESSLAAGPNMNEGNSCPPTAWAGACDGEPIEPIDLYRPAHLPGHDPSGCFLAAHALRFTAGRDHSQNPGDPDN